jgi:hypothetical protein
MKVLAQIHKAQGLIKMLCNILTDLCYQFRLWIRQYRLLRLATSARTKTRASSLFSTLEKADILTPWPTRWTRWTAINTSRMHRKHKRPIHLTIPRQHSLPTTLFV